MGKSSVTPRKHPSGKPFSKSAKYSSGKSSAKLAKHSSVKSSGKFSGQSTKKAKKGDSNPAISHPSLSPKRKEYYIGVDLGGTSVKIGIVNDSGHPQVFRKIPTQGEKGPDNAMTCVSETINELMAEKKISRESIAGVGLATPGTMDIPSGTLLCPANLPSWHNFPIRDRLAEKCGFPVTYIHDASAAAFGEYWQGAGKGEPGLVMMTLGTGIGCGIILKGQVWDGIHCHGGECGHLLIDISENARWCNCGQRGHLEAYASATGVVKRTLEIVQAGLNTTLSQRVHSVDQRQEIPRILYEEAMNDDPIALQIIDETAFYVACGIVSLVHTIDPSCVLIGGAMTFGGEQTILGSRFLYTIRKEFQKRTFRHLAERVQIHYALLGADAGFIGAAGLARQARLERLEEEGSEGKPKDHKNRRK